MPESTKPEQLCFDLPPRDRFSLAYLVRHSGIAYAVDTVETALQRLLTNRVHAEFILVFGPKGSGKTHLVNGFADRAQDLGLRVMTHEFLMVEHQGLLGVVSDDERISALVDGYERLRASGGIAIFSAAVGPYEITTNPHLRSRLLGCQIAEIAYPREEELKTLVLSLLERHNLKLSEASLEYLLRRLPRDPLSFDHIFARINASSLRQARPAGQAVVREEYLKGNER